MSKASRLLKICEQGTILYHGTSEFSWSNNSEESILYLTDSLKDAENYAYEMAAHDEEEGKLAKPVVFRIPLKDLTSFKDVKIGPDYGVANDMMSWQESLKTYGSLTVSGNLRRLKKTFKRIRFGEGERR